MISSEIARASGQTPVSRMRGKKENKVKSNPQLLVPSDNLTLSFASSGSAATITALKSSVSTMMPLGERSQNVSNGGGGAEVATKTSVTKYANPPAVEFQGQMWAIR